MAKHLFSQRLQLTLIACFSLLNSGIHAAETEDPGLAQRLERFRGVEEVMAVIEQEYITSVDRQRLWSGAFNGMTQVLDRHSSYSDQRSEVMYVPGNDQEALGFGFDWTYDHFAGGLVVRRVVPNSSAHKAGMVAGDTLVQINDQPLLGITPLLAAERLALAGNSAQFHVRHANDQVRHLALTRSELNDSGLSQSTLLIPQSGIGLIQLSRFIGDAQAVPVSTSKNSHAQTVTGIAFRSAMEQLSQQGLKGLIIDLRGNGGGSIPAAVEVADCFLSGSPERPVVITRQRGRSPSRHLDWYAKAGNTLANIPLVVLIDNSTASAAEILASALQDHHRAVIVGITSMGKDTVQQTFHLENGGALRLTVARYITPNGASLHGIGVQPDIFAPTSRLELFNVAHRDWLISQGKELTPPYDKAVDSQLLRAQEALTALIVSARRQ